MKKINGNYQKLPGAYLFSEIAQRVKAFKVDCPEADIISLGIGDVTQPLAPAVVEAVAPAIRIPANGARTKAGIFIISRT